MQRNITFVHTISYTWKCSFVIASNKGNSAEMFSLFYKFFIYNFRLLKFFTRRMELIQSFFNQLKCYLQLYLIFMMVVFFLCCTRISSSIRSYSMFIFYMYTFFWEMLKINLINISRAIYCWNGHRTRIRHTNVLTFYWML